MTWTAAQVAERCGGALHGAADAAISGVSTDTRTLGAGDLFVAIAGENFDGHDYARSAAESGAAAVLVSRPVDSGVPEIRVDDTIAALGRFAASERELFSGPVVAITGSNGKTTTRELCADVLEAAGLRTRRSPGNLNNHIGLPISILGLRPGDDVLVVELGMNHPGEIDALSRIASPDVAAITQVAAAHLGPMGSLEAIAAAKGEILDHLRPDGTAVLNADDARVLSQRHRFAGRTLLFGFGEAAEFRASGVEPAGAETRFRLDTPLGSTNVSLALPGCHLVQDALCACAAAFATGRLPAGRPGEDGAALDAMRRALEAFRGVPGRTCLGELPGGVRLLDDAYNANPHSVAAALRALAQLRGGGRCVAVLGDMAELGAEGPALHAQTGRLAAESGVDALLGVGALSEHTVEAAREAGVSHTAHAGDTDRAAEILGQWLRDGFGGGLGDRLGAGDVVLVKGSHSMHMERIPAGLAGAAGND
ncbi:MAG: UDP-N-acetylmuramoyl-tripeptide--D-alanyl-D-alanine ligase [Deltaproteobacteria bacterium]|nr:UDP-N-acetylmuramoyl-tripeptide--D-alanyl-D-alanine ligase [Deltaproteobacteria bacterium]MBW2413396.1 UDP-N-acetylmuramoyl-tripeptide--D-alanyl-D-alanine ligase [Deltaproteobacteria bacterium]